MLSDLRRVGRPGGSLVLDATHRDRLVRGSSSHAPRTAPTSWCCGSTTLLTLRRGGFEIRHHDGKGGADVERGFTNSRVTFRA